MIYLYAWNERLRCWDMFRGYKRWRDARDAQNKLASIGVTSFISMNRYDELGAINR